MQKLRKDQGDTFNSILPNLLCVIIISVFCTLFTSWMANVANRDALNQITRKYILQMETTGYLTGDMKNEMTNELFLAGMRNIKIEPKTTQLANKAEYGEDIYLVVSGYMPVFEYQMNENPDGKFMELEDPNVDSPDSMRWEVYIKKSSISKAPATPIEEPNKFKIKLAVQGLGHTAGNGQITYAGKRVSVVTVEKGEKPTFKFEANAGYYISDVYLDTNRLEPAAYNINAEKTIGQYTVNDGNGVQAPHSIVVVTAPFNNIKYTVNHYQLGFTGNYVLFETETFTGTTDTEVTPTVKKYEGFTSPESQTVVVKSDGSTVVNYYYERNKYFFTFNTNEYIDTSGTSTNGEYYYGQTINLSAKINYIPNDAIILNGWTDNYKNNYNNITEFTMPAKEVIVTPNVSHSKYTITYDPNGGTGTAFTSKELDYFDNYNLENMNFTKEGYKLAGWALEPNAESIVYTLTDTVSKLTTKNNITLYAIWTDLGETQFTVNHFVQLANGEYTEQPQKTEVIDATIYDLITVEDLIIKDYDDNKITYFSRMMSNGHSITSFMPEDNNGTIINMYYDRVQYDFIVSSSTLGILVKQTGETNYSISCRTGDTITFELIVKKGYSFDGWNFIEGSQIDISEVSRTININGDTEIKYSFIMPTNDIAIEATHHLFTYKLEYDLNGGSWEDNYKPYLTYNVETATFTIQNPVRKHYTFIGWTDLNDTGLDTSNGMALQIIQGTTGDINLRAEWLINKYKIKITNVNPNLGTVYINDQQIEFSNNNTYEVEYEYDSKLNIEFKPYKSSIASLIMKEEIDGKTIETVMVDKEIMESKTYNIDSLEHSYNFEVTFVESSYKIIYHANNGTNETFETNILLSDEVIIQRNPWLLNEHDFLGWSTKKVATNLEKDKVINNVVYRPDETYEYLATEPNDTINLYAVWTDTKAPVITYVNTNDISNQQTITVTITDGGVGVQGFIFTDYETDEDVIRTMEWKNNPDYIVNENTEFVYIHGADKVNNITTVGPIYVYQTNLQKTKGTFNYNKNVITSIVGSEIELPTGTLDYHKFLGWSYNSADTTGFKTLTVTNDSTLYPIYKMNGTQLIDGIAFNTAIKQLINTNATFETADTTITNIEITSTAPSNLSSAIKVSCDGLDAYVYKMGSEIMLYTTAEEVYFPVNASYMFYNLQKLSELSILNSGKIKTTKTTDMSWMFAYAGYNGSLSGLNLGKFNTLKVTNMQGMFANCGYSNLASITFGSSFNTANVTNMSAMFENCGYKKLTKLEPSFNTAKVTDMKAMFAYTGYESMTTLTLGSNFKANVLADTSYMFAYTGYKNMTALNITPNFKVPSSANEEWMFLNCGHTKLSSLDISMININTSDITKTEGMLIDCGKDNATITVSNSTAVNYINTNAAKILGTTSTSKTIKAK